MPKPIKFGTDGWRGILADDFTDENVRLAAGAIAHYIREHEDPARGLCIGYDTRFMSQRFAQIVAEVAAAAGIPVRLGGRVTPTPPPSFPGENFGGGGGG